MQNRGQFDNLFASLCQTLVLDESSEKLIEEFVCKMYRCDTSVKRVNDCRLFLHSKGVPLERLPPTHSSLTNHTKRAMLQANTWNNSLHPRVPQRDPSLWGWRMERSDRGLSSFSPLWSDLPSAVSLTEHFVKCSCTLRCEGRCSCRKAKVKCTSLCKYDHELCNTSLKQAHIP